VARSITLPLAVRESRRVNRKGALGWLAEKRCDALKSLLPLLQCLQQPT
jgi:hypothetical protein